MLLITGAAGFIGSALVRTALEAGHDVVAYDALTYAGNPANLAGLDVHFVRGDIRDSERVAKTVAHHEPEAILHLAAESHVDRSIEHPLDFVETNVLGTGVLLEAARKVDIPFVHVSTDEVYGDLGIDDPPFCETTPYAPSSPYSASKAGSDHLVRAYRRTYGLKASITNCSNNYGPRQFPEKLIPRMITNALQGQPLPIFGDGSQVRDWLYVDDHARGILGTLEAGLGKDYMFGGGAERTNLQVVNAICDALDQELPQKAPHADLLEFVQDRPGHDQRYAVDYTRARTELGWNPTRTFAEGIHKTVHWYLENQSWIQAIQDGSYRAEATA